MRVLQRMIQDVLDSELFVMSVVTLIVCLVVAMCALMIAQVVALLSGYHVPWFFHAVATTGWVLVLVIWYWDAKKRARK